MTDRYQHLTRYYHDSSDQEDPARRVRWRTYDGQLLRFQVLLEALRSEAYPVSILDVGCGIGTLYGFLRDTGRLGPYLGIDILPEMIQQARLQYPQGRFEVADLLTFEPQEPYDLVVCSGALNVLVTDHERWVRDMLKALWKHAELAVATNVQTTRAFRFNPASQGDRDLYHAELPAFLAWCEELTPWVTLRQDYLGTEATFYLYKKYHRSFGILAREGSHDPRPELERACGLAYLLMERRLPEQALTVLEKVEVNADVLNYRGMCYHRLGQLEKARECYRGALALDPHHMEANLNLKFIF